MKRIWKECRISWNGIEQNRVTWKRIEEKIIEENILIITVRSIIFLPFSLSETQAHSLSHTQSHCLSHLLTTSPKVSNRSSSSLLLSTPVRTVQYVTNQIIQKTKRRHQFYFSLNLNFTINPIFIFIFTFIFSIILFLVIRNLTWVGGGQNLGSKFR